MGPQRSITTEKDRQIHRLRVLVQVHAVRTSLIQERLRATQDELITLRAVHAKELEAERRISETLRKQLMASQECTRAAELERDDLRTVVNEVVDRVEANMSLKGWPYSRLRATSLLEPAEPLPDAPSPDHTMIYASALVESLTTERDTERRAHKRTKEVSKNTITILEAQLALREAELEDFLGQPPEDLPNLGRVEEPKEMSDEEAHRILELNVARQRRIEMETRALHAKLEGIRSRPRPPNPIDALNAQIQQLTDQVKSFGAELRQMIESEKIDSAEPPREKDLLEAEKDEISMDLARPLFPTRRGGGGGGGAMESNLNHDPLPPPPPETNTPLHSPAETDLLRDLHYP